MLAMETWLDRLETEGWWNWHLWPQSLYLSHTDGAPRAIDRIFDQSELENLVLALHNRTGTPIFHAAQIDALGVGVTFCGTFVTWLFILVATFFLILS